jgi:urea transport system permease protein
VFGWLAFRSRVTGVYLSIITQALTFALMLAFFRNEMGFGGNNGLTDFKDILGFDLQADGTRVGLFVASALALARLPGCAASSSAPSSAAWSSRSATPRAARASSATASNTTSSGLHLLGGARRHRRRALRAAGGHHQPRRVLAAQLHRARDLGGGRRARHALRRSHRRAAGQLRQDLVHRRLPEVWLFALGALFVLVTLFLPRGMVGLLKRRRMRRQAAWATQVDTPAIPCAATGHDFLMPR